MEHHQPAGQTEPRTWAVVCRGTEPSEPSSPEQSGVSTPTYKDKHMKFFSVKSLSACAHISLLHIRHISPQPSPSSDLSLGTQENDA